MSTLAIAASATHLPEGLPPWHRNDPPCPTAHDIPPTEAKRVLGRKGLLNKGPALRAALIATHRALGLGEQERVNTEVDASTGVIAVSDLATLAHITAAADAIADEGWRATSILDAANMSSNVLATAVAGWFKLGGPALVVCSGPQSSTQAVELADAMLANHRCRRMLLLAVEAAHDTEAALRRGVHAAQPWTGAGCLIVNHEAGPGVQLPPIDAPAPGSAALISAAITHAATHARGAA